MSGVAWLIGGTAGEGLESGGEIFASAMAAAGQRPSTGRDFPSRIRGGDTTFTVRLTPGGFLAPAHTVDLALVFNATVAPRVVSRLHPNALLLVDEGVAGIEAAQAHPFPFTKLATEAGDKRAKNMVALGASAALMDAPIEALQEAIERRFKRKGADVINVNLAAFQAGHALAQSTFTQRFPVPEPHGGDAMFLSGNQAFCLGALAADCTVAAAYPITPASDILEFMMARLAKIGGAALQMEDEMAAMGVCIGAAFAGRRALTATSGPGLSLMTEMVGLAEATETPVVIVDCQRPGPSTGMPTKHAQDDVWHLCHGGHGEAVRAVLAPMDVADAHRTAGQAFDLADQFHCPVYVAMDQQMSLMKQTVPILAAARTTPAPRPSGAPANAWDGTYLPYGDAGDAPQLRGRPGEPWGMHLSNSTEHGPNGLTTEDPKIRVAMVERRLQRLRAMATTTDDAVVTFGPPSKTVIVSFGSTVGACQEAGAGCGATVVAVRLLWPLPAQAIADAIGDADRVLVVEANSMGQFESLLRAEVDLPARVESLRRFDGNPITSNQIVEALQ